MPWDPAWDKGQQAELVSDDGEKPLKDPYAVWHPYHVTPRIPSKPSTPWRPVDQDLPLHRAMRRRHGGVAGKDVQYRGLARPAPAHQGKQASGAAATGDTLEAVCGRG